MTIEPQFFEARDGVRLAWREMGEGAPIVLLHGLFSSAEINWIKFGTAACVAREGYRVIMPDLRIHGSSEAPHDDALLELHIRHVPNGSFTDALFTPAPARISRHAPALSAFVASPPCAWNCSDRALRPATLTNTPGAFSTFTSKALPC